MPFLTCVAEKYGSETSEENRNVMLLSSTENT